MSISRIVSICLLLYSTIADNTDFLAAKSPSLPVIYHAHPHHQHTSLVEGAVKLSPDADLFNVKNDNQVESTGRLVGVQGGMPFDEEANMVIQARSPPSKVPHPPAQQTHAAQHAKIAKHGQEDVVRTGPLHPEFVAAPADVDSDNGNGAFKQYDDSDNAADANELLSADSQPEQMTREDEIAVNVGNLKDEMKEKLRQKTRESQGLGGSVLIKPTQPPSPKVAIRPPLVNAALTHGAVQKQLVSSKPAPSGSSSKPAAPAKQPGAGKEAQPALVAALPGAYPGPPAAQAKAEGEDGEPMAPTEVVGMKVDRPKGWDQCLKFARFVKGEDVQGVELIRTWKATCAPAVQSGVATERYRLMCNALQGAVEPYAAERDYDVEQLCDSVLAVFHDVTASA